MIKGISKTLMMTFILIYIENMMIFVADQCSCSLTRTRLEIQADAAFVDLRSRCQFFYEFGCKIAPL